MRDADLARFLSNLKNRSGFSPPAHSDAPDFTVTGVTASIDPTPAIWELRGPKGERMVLSEMKV